MTSSILGGMVTPPPLITRHFLATTPHVRVTRSKSDLATKQRWLLTLVDEGPLQSGIASPDTLGVTIPTHPPLPLQ